MSSEACQCMEEPVVFPNFSWDGDAQSCIEFVAEGAANVVYKIRFPSDHPNHRDVQGTLLRLRKDIPSSNRTLDAQIDFQTVIHPLINDSWFVHQRLVALPDGLIEYLNDRLRLSEETVDSNDHPQRYPSRHPKRHLQYLAKDEFGLLVTDMTPADGGTLFEFKPKWLYPSRSRPQNSIRCRSCARRAQIAAEKRPSEKGFALNCCPISLAKDRERAAEKILDSQNWPAGFVEEKVAEYGDLCTYTKAVTKDLTTVLRGQHMREVLSIISQIQKNFDHFGIIPLFENPPIVSGAQRHKAHHMLRVAMTFRDCTVFIRLPKGGLQDGRPEAVEIRVGDLDLKNLVEKKAKWLDDEKTLIDGGWYEGLDLYNRHWPTENDMHEAAVDCFMNEAYEKIVKQRNDADNDEISPLTCEVKECSDGAWRLVQKEDISGQAELGEASSLNSSEYRIL